MNIRFEYPSSHETHIPKTTPSLSTQHDDCRGGHLTKALMSNWPGHARFFRID
jgi:hypothetical protein